MPLPASGTISISQIATEFGGTTPHSLSEYYGAGGAPASGTISLASFYGRSANFNFTQTISADTTNYNLRNAAVAAGWNGTTPLIASVTINSGVYVSANSTGTWAFDTGSIPAGSTLTLVNNGFIVGMGGAGGAYGDATLNGVGYPGGPALRAQYAISITNNGTIGGGGGGGGRGGTAYDFGLKGQTGYTASGGGGGGGRTGRTNSAGGAGAPYSSQYSPASSPGAPGTVSGGGVGGNGATAAGNPNSGTGGKGGNGGTWGSAGATGATSSGTASNGSAVSPGSAGGASGAAVNGNSFITWVANGTRLGSINAS